MVVLGPDNKKCYDYVIELFQRVLYARIFSDRIFQQGMLSISLLMECHQDAFNELEFQKKYWVSAQPRSILPTLTHYLSPL